MLIPCQTGNCTVLFCQYSRSSMEMYLLFFTRWEYNTCASVISHLWSELSKVFKKILCSGVTAVKATVPVSCQQRKHKSHVIRLKSMPVTHAPTTLFLCLCFPPKKIRKDTFFMNTKEGFSAAARLESQMELWRVSCWMKSRACCTLSRSRVEQTKTWKQQTHGQFHLYIADCNIPPLKCHFACRDAFTAFWLNSTFAMKDTFKGCQL